MLFEGAEKKLELVFREELNLLEFEESFWHVLVERAKAKILSRIDTDSCTAFLLSESSLFVYKRKIILITCGTTTLVDAVESLIVEFGAGSVSSLFYQRKNENFPHYQKTDFLTDCERLNTILPGRVFRFGEQDEHHMYLFHAVESKSQPADDVTVEILMNQLSLETQEAFLGQSATTESIREFGLDRILPGYQIDDFAFEPCGYSLNALCEDKYYTFHVTPQEIGSYVSFETNGITAKQVQEVVDRVIRIFKPNAYDIVVFSPRGGIELKADGYLRRRIVEQSLDSGYLAEFSHFYRPSLNSETAVELTDKIGERV